MTRDDRKNEAGELDDLDPLAEDAGELDELEPLPEEAGELDELEPLPDAPASASSAPADAPRAGEPSAREPTAPRAPEPESPKPERPKLESPKVGSPKAEQPKPEPAKAEPPRSEPPGSESPKAQTPKPEPPQPRPPEPGPPKPEPPQPAAHEPEASKPIPESPAAAPLEPEPSTEAEPAPADTPAPPAAEPAAAAIVEEELPPSGAAPAAPAATPPAAAEGPVERRLEGAPLHLQKAAVIAGVGCLVPWIGHGGTWVTAVAAKLVVLVGAWMFYQTVLARSGGSVHGLVKGLARLRFLKDTSARPKNLLHSAAHAVPSALHVVAWLVVIAGAVVLPMVDPAGLQEEGTLFQGMAEVGMLAWCAGTWVHIFAYTKGGKFNPLFPLMFLGIALGGGANLATKLGQPEKAPMDWVAMAGAAVVVAGGLFATYTIVEAMLEAKRHGDAKREAAREARKAARAAARSSGSGSRRGGGDPPRASAAGASGKK